ncbi:hypothetical protein D9619_002459 [Psilocybe cf. subviscida]|uniref:F-box domain-containing protein n=1 Tax=Psilocybe cf. subviscida TaxID=2480587 RepID=A0A8H5EUL8_9AGAR|nr:hypothetical protein D9619_002459 [Psilocybe cf. subviscida]
MPSIPDKSKPTYIHSYLCEGCVALRDVDQEILDTEAALRRAKERRRAVLKFRNQKHDRVTQLVPPEIASHIFLSLLDLHGSHDRLKALFKLATVCKSWRDIAFLTPQLWTNIRFGYWGQRWRFSRSMAKKWFNRSKSLPMHVTLDWRYRGGWGRDQPAKLDQDLMVTFKLLQQYTQRIQCLEIRIPTEILTYQIFQRTKAIPKIALYVSHLCPGIGFLKQVTYLRIEQPVELVDALNVLQQSPLLLKWEWLKIRESTGNRAVQSLPISVHLQELDIHVEELSEFFDAVTMPTIRRMHLRVSSMRSSDGPESEMTHMSSLATMLTRSTTKLDDFALDYGYKLDDGQITILLDTLRTQQDLRKLSIRLRSYPESDPTALLFQPFLERGPGLNFLPSLQDFSYSLWPISSWAPITAFYQYHSAIDIARSLSVADFSGCGISHTEAPIDEESLRIFLTLPSSNISLKINPSLLAISIWQHKLPTPAQDILSYHGLSKQLQGGRRRILSTIPACNLHMRPRLRLSQAK